jgi:hypothetical protein
MWAAIKCVRDSASHIAVRTCVKQLNAFFWRMTENEETSSRIEPFHQRVQVDTYLNFLRAKKSMEVKREAEKFRVGNDIRNMERRVLELQVVIAVISMVCICLAVLIQEITFYGSYSNSLGGEWFSEPEQPPIKSSDLESSADPKLVVIMKFILLKLTVIQLLTMYLQFKILNSIMIQQKRLDSSISEQFDQPQEDSEQMLTLARTFRHSSSYIFLINACVELAICAVHPPPFLKKRFVTTIIGRDAIYNVESLVGFAPRTFQANHDARSRSRIIQNAYC